MLEREPGLKQIYYILKRELYQFFSQYLFICMFIVHILMHDKNLYRYWTLHFKGIFQKVNSQEEKKNKFPLLPPFLPSFILSSFLVWRKKRGNSSSTFGLALGFHTTLHLSLQGPFLPSYHLYSIFLFKSVSCFFTSPGIFMKPFLNYCYTLGP